MTDPARKSRDETPDPSRFGAGRRPPQEPLPSRPSQFIRLVAMREHSLHALFELSHELSVSLDPGALAEITLLNLMGHAGTAQGVLWMLDESEERRLALTNAHGVARESAVALGALMEGLLSRWTPRSSMPVTIETAPHRLSPEVAAAAEGLGLAVLAPVFASSQVVGCAALGRRGTGEPYNTFDLEVLRTSLGMLGSTTENSRLYRRVRAQYEQLARADAARRELDRMKSEFLQNVNHELRTPLAVIGGAIECLLAEPDSDSRRGRLLKAIHEHSGLLTEMVQSLLDFSSSMDPSVEVKRGPFDPRELIESFAEDARPRVEGAGRALEVVIEDGVPQAVGDRAHVPNVLERLLENAIKFSPPGTPIEVGVAAAEPDRVRFWVRDEGPGVPPDRRVRIFEAFAQGDGSMTRKAGGMGLGLAAARRWAHLMGGALQLDDGPGPGAKFSLLLPRA